MGRRERRAGPVCPSAPRAPLPLPIAAASPPSPMHAMAAPVLLLLATVAASAAVLSTPRAPRGRRAAAQQGPFRVHSVLRAGPLRRSVRRPADPPGPVGRGRRRRRRGRAMHRARAHMHHPRTSVRTPHTWRTHAHALPRIRIARTPTRTARCPAAPPTRRPSQPLAPRRQHAQRAGTSRHGAAARGFKLKSRWPYADSDHRGELTLMRSGCMVPRARARALAFRMAATARGHGEVQRVGRAESGEAHGQCGA